MKIILTTIALTTNLDKYLDYKGVDH